MYKNEIYGLRIKIKNSEIPLVFDAFHGFMISEVLHYGMYIAELNLSPLLFVKANFETGEKLTVIIDFYSPKYKRRGAKDQTDIIESYTFNFTIFDYKMSDNSVKIVLVPSFYEDFVVKLKNRVFNGSVKDIVQSVISPYSFTEEMEGTGVLKKRFYQINESDFSFIRNISNYAKGRNPNFLFFINKENKVFFESYDFLKNKKETWEMEDAMVSDKLVSNYSFAFQSLGGAGIKGRYFDWETGTFKEISFIPDTKVLTEHTFDNSMYLFLGNVSNSDDKTMYNNYVENYSFRKNTFKLFVDFKCVSSFVLFDKLTVGETLRFNFVQPGGKADYLSGKYFIYKAEHIFHGEGLTSSITLATDGYMVDGKYRSR